MAFEAQTAPQRSSDLRVVAPMHPSPPGSPTPTLRLHRLEGFTRNEFGSPHARKQDQHIRRHVGQVIVSGLVLPPTAGDFSAQDSSFLSDRSRLGSPTANWSRLASSRATFYFSRSMWRLVWACRPSKPPVSRKSGEGAGCPKVQHCRRDQRPDFPVPARTRCTCLDQAVE